MAEVKRYTISIGGQQYSLVSDEGQESVSTTANMVDELVEQILHNRTDVSFDKAAVLTALKLAQRVQELESTVQASQEHSNNLAELIDTHL